MVKIRKLASIEKGLEEIIRVLTEEEIKKAINKGATDIRVAAETTDQSTPDSGAPKTPRPTVSGRVSTELVTINGQRKLFQW